MNEIAGCQGYRTGPDLFVVQLFRSLFVLSFLLVVSCAEDDESVADYSANLNLRTVLSLELDSVTSYEFYNIYYYENDSGEYLINVNRLINGFNVYDLNERKQISRVSLPKTGPNGMRGVYSLTIANLDSIYLYNQGGLRDILVTDYKGNLKKRLRSLSEFREPGTPGGFPYIGHASSPNAPTILKDNKLYFSKYSNFDYYLASNINDSYAAEIVYDLNSGEINPLPVTFPKWMQNKIWHMYYLLHSKTINDKGQFVFSFSGEDSIRVSDLSGAEDVYEAKYDKKQKVIKPYGRKITAQQQLEHGLESYIYTQIIFDSYRQVYYRILERPVNYDSRKHRNVRAYHTKPVSCIILDLEFNKIGEFDFPDSTYRSYGSFVGRDGLYMPRLNPAYKYFSEDNVDYSVYELVYF